MITVNQLWRGALAGLLGGLAGSFVMAQLSVWAKQAIPSLAGASGDTHEEEAHDPKVKLAETMTAQEPSPALAKIAKPLVHYGFGAGIGTAYGALAAGYPAITAGRGLPFGTAVWLAADEAGLKAFRLARAQGQPTSAHLLSLSTHLIFGAVTELVRRELVIRRH